MKYWNKKLKCWWDDQYIVEKNGKIYQGYVRDGEVYGIDITEYIEIKN